MENNKHSIQLGGKEISFEFSNLAENANGNVIVRTGDTVILVTAVASDSPREGQDWFPLTVDYEEKFYAAGKILGSRFMRREGRPSDEAIITSRVIDRAIRPLFPKDFKNEVQVIATCLSWDAENDADIPGLLGASVALSISDIPWAGPLGALRVARVNDSFVLNPTYEQRAQSDIDFVLAGVKEGSEILLNMIEAESQEVSEDVFQEALAFAKPHFVALIEFQEELVKKMGKEKSDYPKVALNEALEKEFRDFLGDKLEKALFEGDRMTRMKAVSIVGKELISHLEEQNPEAVSYAKDFLEEETDRIVHAAALEREQRVDDRKLNEIRPLEGMVGFLPRTHGSGLFTRGQTRTLSIVTLGSPGDQRLVEGMEVSGKKHFMHHYNFPPYAPGDVKPMRGPGRREIGHGLLAEKALLPVIPSIEDFPYTKRIVTECVSSNGSTSMASVCSATLALMDAGVPITRPVAGISMGLMLNDAGDYKLLTDIQGPEDHYGDMDFKVAGTKEGITSIQLDVKVRGVTEQMFKETLAETKRARYYIIDEIITKTIAQPREKLSQWAPAVLSLQINPQKIGLLIGPGGKMINKIIEDYGVQVDVEDTGDVFVTGENGSRADEALEFIKDLTREIKVGEIFQGEVKRILDFGAFVEISGGQDGLLHISQLDNRRVEKVEDVIKIGDIIPVKVIGIDEEGKIRLSLKEARDAAASHT